MAGNNWALGLKAGLTALWNPLRQDAVATLAETTSSVTLSKLRRQMLLDPVGRQILRERPLISSESLDRLLSSTETSSPETFGGAYARFLRSQAITPDSRSPIRHIDDPDLAYVMLRYRQVHDFWHVLFGLESIKVESELALKCIEHAQTGLTMTLLASLIGPLKLDAERRDVLLTQIAPWALQSGAKASFLLNVYYEKELDKPLEVLQRELNITPLPKDLKDKFLQLHHSSNKRL